MAMPLHRPLPRRDPPERGAVLIVGLVVLLVLTILGVSAMQTSVLQERMAGNLRQTNVALQAAEAALQAGLAYVELQPDPPLMDDSGTDNVWTACKVNGAGCDRDIVADWSADLAKADDGIAYDEITLPGSTAVTVSGLANVAAQPRVYIEGRYVPPLDVEDAAEGKGVHYYTVTAIGFGENEKAASIVQSTIAKVYRYP